MTCPGDDRRPIRRAGWRPCIGCTAPLQSGHDGWTFVSGTLPIADPSARRKLDEWQCRADGILRTRQQGIVGPLRFFLSPACDLVLDAARDRAEFAGCGRNPIAPAHVHTA